MEKKQKKFKKNSNFFLNFKKFAPSKKNFKKIHPPKSVKNVSKKIYSLTYHGNAKKPVCGRENRININ